MDGVQSFVPRNEFTLLDSAKFTYLNCRLFVCLSGICLCKFDHTVSHFFILHSFILTNGNLDVLTIKT